MIENRSAFRQLSKPAVLLIVNCRNNVVCYNVDGYNADCYVDFIIWPLLMVCYGSKYIGNETIRRLVAKLDGQ